MIFGILPIFFLYKPVARAAPLDFAIFVFWAIAFGLMTAIFYKDQSYQELSTFRYRSDNDHEIVEHWFAMRQKIWANLGVMVLFLFSSVMGAGLLWVERRRRVQGKASLV